MHTHILWGIDDGSKSCEMSLKMLKVAVDSGTKEIFATPHIIESFSKPSWEEIKEKVCELQQLAVDQGIAIKIYPGAEVQMNWELLPELGENGAYCLNGGKYLLVELPATEIPNYADDFWYELELKGVVPILAHPERYNQLNKHIERISIWRNRGILMQHNSGSYTGMFGSSVAKQAQLLMENGLIDLFGSDAHRSEGRNTDISAAIQMLKDAFGEAAVEQLLIHNPKKVLSNSDIERHTFKMIKKQSQAGLWQKIFGK